MQVNTNSTNSRFLEEYRQVLCHHINCILKSCMILDEDMQLVTTFWVPNLISKKSLINHFTLASITCATVGLFVSVRLHNLYPFTFGAVPAAIQLCNQIKGCYYERKYKRNFEKLISLMRELYELNRNILEYFNKRNVATQDHKMSEEITGLLLKPGQKFLNQTILLLIAILEKLKGSMHDVCKLVPISEGEYIYSLKWNLEEFKKYDDNDFDAMKHHFERLCDLYVLMISNFLSCIGLSLCVQLWQEVCCKFQNIFDNVIPGLCHHLQSTLSEIKSHFNCIRFSLPDVDDETSKQHAKLTNNGLARLQQPVSNLLVNLQVAFESAKQLQFVIEKENSQVNYENLIRIVDHVVEQLGECDFATSTVERLLCSLANRSREKNMNPAQLPPVDDEPIVKREIHYDDDSEEPLEDEEYNLSIHGSDPEESMEAICEYADKCSTEYLEIMLYELKRKLNERQIRRGRVGIQETEPEIQQPTPPPPPLNKNIQNQAPPIPPPPIMIRSLPPIDSDQLSFLDAVKNIAQNLNRDEEFQFGFNMFPEIPRPFNTTYRCFSVAMLPGNERQDVESGGKIIMPPSALEQLTRLNINYPMLFKIVNKKTSRTTHCGVLEFVADEGKVYLPLWMMHNLVLEEGDIIQIESVSLPVGTFAKFQPLSPDFLDITNPKAVLENCLRTFACLTSGDVIAVKYNQRIYELCVLETQPGNAISIIECDMNVEFAPPVGYKESEEVKQSEEDMVVDPADLMPEPSGFVAFRGTGNRLDGKRRKDSGPSDSSTPKPVYVRGIPDYDYQIGTLRFLRHITKSPVSNNKEENGEFKAFSGEGFSLKRRN